MIITAILVFAVLLEVATVIISIQLMLRGERPTGLMFLVAASLMTSRRLMDLVTVQGSHFSTIHDIAYATQGLIVSGTLLAALILTRRALDSRRAVLRDLTAKSNELEWRVYELNALHDLARIAEEEDATLDESLGHCVSIVLAHLEECGIVAAQLWVRGKRCHLGPELNSLHTADHPILINGKTAGTLRVWQTPGTHAVWAADQERLFRSMAERISTLVERSWQRHQARLSQQHLERADKMSGLGTLLSGVAHEINNPNYVIMSGSSVLHKVWVDLAPILDSYAEEKGDFPIGGMSYASARNYVPQLLAAILEGGGRIKHVIQELRDFATQGQPELMQNVPINAVVVSAVTLVSNLVRKHTDNFTVRYADDLPPVRGHYQRLEQVVINIIQNACQALASRNAAIRVETRFDSLTRCIAIDVLDEGAGILPEHMSQIAVPFFTTRRDHGHHGLGLSIASSIIQEHGGELHVASREGQGTTVTVVLPTPRETADTNTGTSQSTGQPSMGPTGQQKAL